MICPQCMQSRPGSMLGFWSWKAGHGFTPCEAHIRLGHTAGAAELGHLDPARQPQDVLGAGMCCDLLYSQARPQQWRSAQACELGLTECCTALPKSGLICFRT